MTNNLPLELLVQQPWTVTVTHDDENGYVARVKELPDAIATADTPRELDREFWSAVRASLAARIEFGQTVPVVEGFSFPTFSPRPLIRMECAQVTAGQSLTRVLLAR